MSGFSSYTLPGQAVNSTITITGLNSKGITDKAHVFIGVRFTDNNGATVTPGAGTYTITAETLNNAGVYQSIVGGTAVDATAALGTLSCSGSVIGVKVVSTGITTATKVDTTITAHAS